MMSSTGTLHLHAQPEPHQEAWIVGDAAALVALRDAIDQAIAAGSGGSSAAHTFAADGEGYAIIVVNSSLDDESMLPYATQASDPTRRHPYDLLPPGRYRKLVRGE